MCSGNGAVHVAVCRTDQYDRADTGQGLTFWEFRRNNDGYRKTGVGQIWGGGYAKALLSLQYGARQKIKKSQNTAERRMEVIREDMTGACGGVGEESVNDTDGMTEGKDTDG